MKKLLLTTLCAFVGCNVENTKSDSGEVNSPPVETCDFVESFIDHQSPETAQFITTLPVFSEYSLCGNNTHMYLTETIFQVDQDHYLFPLVSLENTVTVNFVVDTESNSPYPQYHTPTIKFHVVYDGGDPIQIAYFIGAITNVTVLDWQVPTLGEYQNDLIVEVSSFVNYPVNASSSQDYTLKFW